VPDQSPVTGMNADVLVIVDSTFGNTAKVAQAIARGVGSSDRVRVMTAADATGQVPAGCRLLFVGGPTQRHRPSPTLAGFLDGLPRRSLGGVPAATFDTRYRMSAWLTGSAARAAAQRLRRSGCRITAPPESFFMERDMRSKGTKRRHDLETLEPGELDRAEAWGRAVAVAVLDGLSA
jgi:flavorubredoxin